MNFLRLIVLEKINLLILRRRSDMAPEIRAFMSIIDLYRAIQTLMQDNLWSTFWEASRENFKWSSCRAVSN